MAGEILPGAGAIVGETLADVLDLDTWTETRPVTTRRTDRKGQQKSRNSEHARPPRGTRTIADRRHAP